MGRIVPYTREETLTEADRVYLTTRAALSPQANLLVQKSEPPSNLSYVDADGWGAATLTVTYDAKALFNIDDATTYEWSLKDVDDSYTTKGGSVTHPSLTQVQISFEIAPGASTYQLVGAR
jgi:hypothetical protein